MKKRKGPRLVAGRRNGQGGMVGQWIEEEWSRRNGRGGMVGQWAGAVVSVTILCLSWLASNFNHVAKVVSPSDVEAVRYPSYEALGLT